MNNLIINGIDHGKFDLEWAKRGGVLVSLESENTRINMFKFLRSITAEKIEVSTMSQRCLVTNFYEYRRVFRMATPSECAEAGIEYIEPPARWLPIESAPKDGRRILIKDYGTVYVAGWGHVVDDIYGWVIVNDCYIQHSDTLLWMEPPKDE